MIYVPIMYKLEKKWKINKLFNNQAISQISRYKILKIYNYYYNNTIL